MKKLALGLLLTAGICGNAWASEGKVVEKKDNKVQKAILKIATVKSGGGGLDMFLAPGDCLILTEVTFRDQNGVKTGSSTQATIGHGDQCKNAVGGYKTNKIDVSLEGTI
ncbi:MULTISPECIES: hypothetical protein [Amniculibacterium]|uniref:hypothetical protein n=1 Tax=Amniculibacterium TaxID=2715289 RepID=UPI000F5B826F|nr:MULTISPECIES: hypothetical protein [Amniculibacterium]